MCVCEHRLHASGGGLLFSIITAIAIVCDHSSLAQFLRTSSSVDSTSTYERHYMYQITNQYFNDAFILFFSLQKEHHVICAFDFVQQQKYIDTRRSLFSNIHIRYDQKILLYKHPQPTVISLLFRFAHFGRHKSSLLKRVRCREVHERESCYPPVCSVKAGRKFDKGF